METTESLAERVGVASACDGMGVARSMLYHRRVIFGTPDHQPKPRPVPARALSSRGAAFLSRVGG